MPNVPHIVSGNVRKGPLQGISIVSTTIQGEGEGGQTINLFVSHGVQVAVSQTVSIAHSNGTLTATTDSLGDYSIDLASLSSYSFGDALTVTVDTRDSTSENLDVSHRTAKAYKQVLVDKRGKEFDELYPLPVIPSFQLNSHPNVVGNVETSFTITREDGQPDSETVTLPDGTQYRRTFGYNNDNRVVYRGRWIKQ